MKAKLSQVLVVASSLFPVMAFAQTFNGGYFTQVVNTLYNVVNILIPVFIGLIVLYFIWGLIKYVQGGDDEKMKEARNTMIYGVIAIFIAVSIWGLVNVLRNVTGATNNQVNPPVVPLQ